MLAGNITYLEIADLDSPVKYEMSYCKDNVLLKLGSPLREPEISIRPTNIYIYLL